MAGHESGAASALNRRSSDCSPTTTPLPFEGGVTENGAMGVAAAIDPKTAPPQLLEKGAGRP